MDLPVGADAEDFRCLLAEGKDFVFRIGESGSTLSDSELAFIDELYFASRQGYCLARGGCIDDSEYQEMTMVVLFANLGTLFNIEFIRESLRTSIFKRKDTMMELYLPPDEAFASDLLHHTGKGIFRLATYLKQAPILPDRCGQVPCQNVDRRWEVPLAYVICRTVYDIFMKQRFATSLQCFLRKVDQILSKLPHARSSQKAGIDLFLLDLVVSKDTLPDGLTLDFVIDKRLLPDSCYCLRVAAGGCGLSVDDVRALCVEKLLQHDSDNDQVLDACSKLYREFRVEEYLKQLEKYPSSNEESPAPSSSYLRNRLLDPAYVLHTYMGYLLVRDEVLDSVSLAAKVEEQGILPFTTQIKLYEQVFDYHLQEGTLFYHCQGDWTKRSHAVAYIPLAGNLGIQVLVNSLHRLADKLPEKHFSLSERQYIYLASHQTVLWILRLKYGSKLGLQQFASRKYWNPMPVLSPEKLEEWACEFLHRDNPIPGTIETIVDEKGGIHPDLDSLFTRTKFEPIAIGGLTAGTGTGAPEGTAFDDKPCLEQELLAVEEEIISSREGEGRDDGDMEVDQDEGFAKEEYVWGQSAEGVAYREPETRRDDAEPEMERDHVQAVVAAEEQTVTKDRPDALDLSGDEDEVGDFVVPHHASANSYSVEQAGSDGEPSAGDAEIVEDDDQPESSSVGKAEAPGVDTQTPPRQAENEDGDEEESSQVERGYEAEESQEEEEEPQPSGIYLGGTLTPETPGSRDASETRRLVPAKRAMSEAFPSPELHYPIMNITTGGLAAPDAFSQVDPGYEAEDSQCPTDFEETVRQEKKPRLESGYDAGESQGHTEDEDDEEMHTEEEKEELQEQPPVYMATSPSTQRTPTSKIERQPASTLSDMSAADERTTGFDDDIAENSELEDLDRSKRERVSALPILPRATVADNASASLLVRFASAVQREDETLRATLQESSVSGEKGGEIATDMSVAGSASLSVSIESEENDGSVRHAEDFAPNVVDHVPEDPLDTQGSLLSYVQADAQREEGKHAPEAASPAVKKDSGSQDYDDRRNVLVAGDNEDIPNETVEPDGKKKGENSKVESESLVDNDADGYQGSQENELPPLPPSVVLHRDDGPATDAGAEEWRAVLPEGQEETADIADVESWHSGRQEPVRTPPRLSFASTGTQTGKDVDFPTPHSRTSDITVQSPSSEPESGRRGIAPTSLRSSGSKRSRLVWRQDEDSSDEDSVAGREHLFETCSPKRHKGETLEVIDEEPIETTNDGDLDSSEAPVESLGKPKTVGSNDEGEAGEPSTVTSPKRTGKQYPRPARKSRAGDDGGRQNAENSNNTLSSEEKRTARATRPTRRSTLNKPTASKSDRNAEEELTAVRRSTPSRNAKSANGDELVASTARSTRRSTRNESGDVEDGTEEVDHTTSRRSTLPRKAKLAHDDESIAPGARSTRRSTRSRAAEEKEEESLVEKEPTDVRRSALARKAKSANDDKSVASTARSTRRSTRNKSAEDDAVEKRDTVHHSTTTRKAKLARDDESVPSAAMSTRRSTRKNSAEKDQETVKEEPATVRRSTLSRKAKSSKNGGSVASKTRSTQISSHELSAENDGDKVQEEPAMVRRSTPSRKVLSSKDDESVPSAARSTRRSTRKRSAKEGGEGDKEQATARRLRRLTPSRAAKSGKDDASLASFTTRSTRRSTRLHPKDEVVGVTSRSTRTRKATSTDEASPGSETRSTRSSRRTRK